MHYSKCYYDSLFRTCNKSIKKGSFCYRHLKKMKRLDYKWDILIHIYNSNKKESENK